MTHDMFTMWQLLLAVLLTILPMGCTKSRSANNQAPNVTWQLGIVTPNSAQTKEFQWVNESKKLAKITSISSSCDCTVANVIKDIAAPGESFSVVAKFVASSTVSDIDKHIAITTDAASAPLIIRLTGKIRPVLALSTPHVNFAIKEGDVPKPAVVYIANFGSSDWQGLKLSADKNWIHATLQSAGADRVVVLGGGAGPARTLGGLGNIGRLAQRRFCS